MITQKIGIVGTGGIGLSYAAWLSLNKHDVTMWAPRSNSEVLQRNETVKATGIINEEADVKYAFSAKELANVNAIIIITVPVNGHRTVMDLLLPHLTDGQIVIISSMSSLSSLYLYEASLARGVRISVVGFGTTAFTARRLDAETVKIMSKRPKIGVSCLPLSLTKESSKICRTLFGCEVTSEDNPLLSTLSNVSAVGHVPLALFNWTRIERAENWPQYLNMTPHVAKVIMRLDAERTAVGNAFGWSMPSFEVKLRQSFNLDHTELPEIAAELHKMRGGPAGPVDISTRYLWEDVPYGLLFLRALGKIANVKMPATDAMLACSAALLGEEVLQANDLLEPLRLDCETMEGLLVRFSAGQS